jgi:hypothetical protein
MSVELVKEIINKEKQRMRLLKQVLKTKVHTVFLR